MLFKAVIHCNSIKESLNKDSKTQKNQITNETGTHCDVLQTFFMVTTFEFFKMFDSFRTSKRVICDLEICFQDFLIDNSFTQNTKNTKKNKRAAKEDDESKPEWIDMLVEMLLNLLTINKAWLRSAIKQQFRKLIPKLTYSSVKLIVDVICFNFDLCI